MRLHSLKIKGFRRLKNIEILFGDTTFLIGQNNCGKSSIFKAIETLLKTDKRLSDEDYYSIVDDETGEVKTEDNTVILEAEFRNVPIEAREWRGFKGRMFSYESEDDTETGNSITYRKTYELGKDVVIEMKTKKRTKKEEFSECKKPRDYINKGIDSGLISELFPDLDKNITSTNEYKLNDIDEIWDISEGEEWFKNPGGIPGNVLKMLPRFLLIPVGVGSENIQGAKGALSETLTELFQTVREKSNNFMQAQHYLNELSKELDPTDNNSEFGKMMTELNGILCGVFPDSKLHAMASLSEPTSLKPSFNIQMSSNITTPVDNQGTGMIRSAVFGILRYRQKLLSEKEDEHQRSLIICFEEPEIYLHPSAANQMRNTLYELSSVNSQIVATTHSPYLIDISRERKQILNRLKNNENFIICDTFSVWEQFKKLQENDKIYVKMLLKIDDYVSRVFFTKNVVIIEGDTEEIVIKESLRRLDKEQYLRIVSDFEIIKARGKATIISLVKYLVSMGIEPIVVHDKDSDTPNAEKFNDPIFKALNGKGKRIFMENNIEEELGYTAPSSDKPYKAYTEIEQKGANWENLPERWRDKMKEIFKDYIN